MAELGGQCLNAVGAAREQREAVASPMPDDAPVMTATRPVF